MNEIRNTAIEEAKKSYLQSVTQANKTLVSTFVSKGEPDIEELVTCLKERPQTDAQAKAYAEYLATRVLEKYGIFRPDNYYGGLSPTDLIYEDLLAAVTNAALTKVLI